MKTDTEIKVEGTKVLIEALGTVHAERYISLIARERFDYTEWRKTCFPKGVLRKSAGQQCGIEKKQKKSGDRVELRTDSPDFY